jgi:hypothetical protein
MAERIEHLGAGVYGVSSGGDQGENTLGSSVDLCGPDMVAYQTGATRSADKLYDPEGFLHPLALQAFCEYMERHRVQRDGQLRDSDNWQKGMPEDRAMKSLVRHAFDAWLMHRGCPPKSDDCESMEDALCALVFNAFLLIKQGRERSL